MPDLEPITRLEEYLSKLAGDDVAVPEPITRVEKFLAYIAGEADSKPTPITRIEKFLDAIDQGGGGGGGGSATIIEKNITANGDYDASSDSADGYNPVHVSVPNSYSAGDEGKVVSSGALVSQSTQEYTSNGVYDTTLIDEVTVNVSGGGSPLTLLVNDEVAINTSSTTETEYKTYTLSFTDDRPNTGYLCVIYDKAGVRTGYFNRSIQASLVGAIGTPRPTVYDGQGNYTSLVTPYGVYISFSVAKTAKLCAKYNSNYGTIDGTYVVKIYAVDLTALM